MLKILSTVTLVLMLILALPVGLIMISQDASKGQLMYPVKRGLENSILAVASLTPYTKAFFAVALSNRRYEETEKLLALGENADISLQDLVIQTSSAADDIGKVSSSTQRAKLIADLSSAIEKYDKGLEGAQVSIESKSEINSQRSGTPSPNTKASAPPNTGMASQLPAATVQPMSSVNPQAPAQQSYDPILHETLREQREAIERTRRELEELRMRLEIEQKNLQQGSPSPVKPAYVAPPSLPPIHSPTSWPTQAPSPSPSSRSFYGTASDSVPAASIQPSPSPSAVSSSEPAPSHSGKKRNSSMQDNVEPESYEEREN